MRKGVYHAQSLLEGGRPHHRSHHHPPASFQVPAVPHGGGQVAGGQLDPTEGDRVAQGVIAPARGTPPCCGSARPPRCRRSRRAASPPSAPGHTGHGWDQVRAEDHRLHAVERHHGAPPHLAARPRGRGDGDQRRHLRPDALRAPLHLHVTGEAALRAWPGAGSPSRHRSGCRPRLRRGSRSRPGTAPGRRPRSPRPGSARRRRKRRS